MLTMLKMLKGGLILAAFAVQMFLCAAIMLSAPHERFVLVASALGYGLAACMWGTLAKGWAKWVRCVYGGVLGFLFFLFCLMTEDSEGMLGFLTASAMLWLLVLPVWMRRPKTYRTWLMAFVIGVILLLVGLGALYVVGSALAPGRLKWV